MSRRQLAQMHLVVLFFLLTLVAGCAGTSESSSADTTPADTAAADTASDVTTTDAGTEELLPEETIEEVPRMEEVEACPFAATSFATFNAGLARNFVLYAEERVQAVVEAVAAVPADVLCLQEVWEEADFTAVIEGAKGTFPYAYMEDTFVENSGVPACTEDETTPLVECVYEFCTDNPDLTGCVMDNCLDPFLAVSKPCSDCLVANIGKPTVDEIAGACLTGSASLVWDGRNGLVLLSKYPLNNLKHFELDFYIMNRSVLYATIGEGDAMVHLFCTHLSTYLAEVEYNGKYDSWEAEQAAQIGQILEFMDSEAADAPAVLMGDMNCSPEIAPAIDGDNPENFQQYIDGGLQGPYLDGEAPECTWCAENTLTDADTKNRILDHVLLDNFGDWTAEFQGERIVDEPVEIMIDGEAAMHSVSDHFGAVIAVP